MPIGVLLWVQSSYKIIFYRIKKYNIKLKVWTFKIFTLTLQSGVATQPHPIFL